MDGEHQENELLDRAVGGDQVALERLMMLHHARLSANFSKKLPVAMRGLITVDDMLQETYYWILVLHPMKIASP